MKTVRKKNRYIAMAKELYNLNLMAESEEEEGHSKSITMYTNHCIPMVYQSRKEELSTFSIEDNDIFLVRYPSKLIGKIDIDADISRTIVVYCEEDDEKYEREDHLFALYIYLTEEELIWRTEDAGQGEMEQISTEDMGKTCRRVLSYVMEHMDDSDNTLSLYLKLFDLFDGYQEVLLAEILQYFDSLMEEIGSNYEQHKRLNKFLQMFSDSIVTALKHRGIFTISIPGNSKRFLTRLIQAFMEYLSVLLKKNKFTRFVLEENTYIENTKEMDEMYVNVHRDLQYRTLIFNEIQKFLKRRMEKGYSPARELLYYLPRVVDHPAIVFEAIESYVARKLRQNSQRYEALNSMERLQFLFPELVLLLDKEKGLHTFVDPNTVQITIDYGNKIYRKLKEREQPGLFDPKEFFALGGRINELGWCNLAACDVYNITYSTEVEACNHPGKGTIFYGLSEKEKRKLIEENSEDGAAWRYKVFIKQCEDDGEWFYDCTFDVCHESDDDIELTLKDIYRHDKNWNAHNLMTPLEDEIYSLQRFLGRCESVRALFNGSYRERVFDIFCRYLVDTMKWGNCLIYHLCFKQYWSDDQLKTIEKKLKERKAAEDYFLAHFEADGLPLDETFKRHARRCPWAFCYAFVGIYMSKAIQEKPEAQSSILKLFCLTLHKVRILRIQIYNQKPECRRFRDRIYFTILSAGKYVPIEVEIIFKRHWTDIINLYVWKAEINEYDKSAITDISVLPVGAYSAPAVVKVPDFASEVVAKYFTSLTETNAVDEIECLMKLQFNPHVVQIYGHIVEQGTYVGVLMEYCRGDSLAKVISSDKEYGEKEILWWATQAACGICFLHKKGIIHRDVKPANMLLDKDHNILKISDLGLSKVSPEPTKPLSEVNFHLSRWCGTSGFAPPEIGELYSAEIDVFALGRSVWSMISRKDPFDPVLSESLQKGPPDGISTELWEFAIRMFDADKDARPMMDDSYAFFKQLHDNQTG